MHHLKKSPTRGWRTMSPKSPKARRTLKKSCGTKCFLSPKNNKFPICAKKSKKCIVNCKGLLSTKIRASQYGYKSISRQANLMAIKKKCSWALSPKNNSPKKSKARKSHRSKSPKRSKRRSPLRRIL